MKKSSYLIFQGNVKIPPYFKCYAIKQQFIEDIFIKQGRNVNFSV